MRASSRCRAETLSGDLAPSRLPLHRNFSRRLRQRVQLMPDSVGVGDVLCDEGERLVDLSSPRMLLRVPRIVP